MNPLQELLINTMTETQLREILRGMVGEVERLQRQRDEWELAARGHMEWREKNRERAERLRDGLNEIAGFADDRPGSWAAMHARKVLGFEP